jgi:heme exporter protein A
VPPTLALSGVAHRFGRRWVLRGVDLTVGSGEVVAVAGSNGAGKTTLLRIAATLLRPTRGGGRVRDADLVRDAGVVREKVSYMGHSPALYEDLTALENLAFAFRMRGLPADPVPIRRVLREVGLEEHGEVRVRRFSSGMRRRVGLARVLSAPPDLLLMDEPYAGMDHEGVALANRVVDVVVALGGSVLMATHDFAAGGEVTHRVVTLTGGRLLQDATA